MRLLLSLLLLASSPAAADAPKPAPAETERSLLDRARQLEDKKDWAAAREIYRKLESFDAHRKVALYKQAVMAYEQRDLADALTLAQRAVSEGPGPRHLEAKVLYGDILFAQGLYQRAKDVFIATHRLAPTVQAKSEIANKVVATNKALKLSARDGL